MKTLINIFFALIIAVCAAQPALAQETKAEKRAAKEAAIKQLIQSKNYVFKAQYVFPMDNNVVQLLNNPTAGNPRYLNSNYDVKVAPDTVTSYLPYFGQAYFNVGYGSTSDNGIKFTSTNFEYTTTVKKNGTSLITIKPKDAKYTNQLILTIANEGSASLSVISVNRQSINFTGYIEEPEKPQTNTKD